MALDLGKIGMTLGGIYDNTKIYNKLDIVVYQGSSYTSKIDNNNKSITDSSAWQLTAQKGDTGVKGDKGDTGYKTIDPYPLLPTDPTPTVQGWYKPLVSSASPGTNYPNAGNLKAITSYDTLFNLTGTTWTKYETPIPGNAAKPSFDITDNVFAGTMMTTNKYIEDNSKRYMQKVIDDSIGGNQTELKSFGKDTSYVSIANSNIWVGNKVAHASGVLKSITINALRAESYNFVVATLDTDSKLTLTNTYFSITATTGTNTYNVPTGITLAPNQTILLSLNTPGKIGYTQNPAITEIEFVQMGNGTGTPNEFNYTKAPGYAPWMMNIEVHIGRAPFTVDEMMLEMYNLLNNVGYENLDFSTVVSAPYDCTIKYTKLSSLTAFTKGSMLFGKVVIYKLTGGAITFSSDFVPVENSKSYDTTKTNIISFWKEYDKVRYSIEVQPLEPIT